MAPGLTMLRVTCARLMTMPASTLVITATPIHTSASAGMEADMATVGAIMAMDTEAATTVAAADIMAVAVATTVGTATVVEVIPVVTVATVVAQEAIVAEADMASAADMAEGTAKSYAPNHFLLLFNNPFGPFGPRGLSFRPRLK